VLRQPLPAFFLRKSCLFLQRVNFILTAVYVQAEWLVKDLIEPFLYPHNLFFWGLVIAAVRYRRWGLWLLLGWFYLFGNGWVANQVRYWYNAEVASTAFPADFSGNFVLPGCGGDEKNIPDCAKARLSQLAELVNQTSHDAPLIHITTLHCKPYLDYLRPMLKRETRLDCFHGGATTYHEFYTLNSRLDHQIPLWFVTSDYHAYRVHQLALQYGFNAKVYAAPSSTFRPVNCGAVCFLTVNLSNFDLFAKLSAEMSSFYVYRLTKSFTDWSK
jgi:hypothetical protein